MVIKSFIDHRFNIDLFTNTFGLQNLTVVGVLLGPHNSSCLPFHPHSIAVSSVLFRFLLSNLPSVTLFLDFEHLHTVSPVESL